MGHYMASTFTSHVWIPFDYSALLQLRDKMIEQMDRYIPDLDHFNFNLDQYNWATLNSTFELYKSDIHQVFRLFKDLLASLPHDPERQQRQWDIALFVAATAALTLSTYNTVQISKLESAIEAQKQQTDLLADSVRLHEQHLHKLDEMIEDIGNEIQKLKVQSGFHFSIDRAIAQVISDTNKLRAAVAIFERVINSAFDQKLAPGALSVDILETIVHHIKDMAAKNKFHNFIHQLSDHYKLETSFIYCPEEHMVILILHVPYVETENLLPLYEFISLLIYFNFSSNVSVILDIGKQDLIAIGNTEAFKLFQPLTWPTANALAKLSSGKATQSCKPTSSMTVLDLFISGAPLSSNTTANFASIAPGKNLQSGQQHLDRLLGWHYHHKPGLPQSWYAVTNHHQVRTVS